MSTETTTTDAEHAHHPTPADYVRIAIILAVLTALEISTYFYDFGVLGIPLLIVLMIVKFVYVARWFMHLKFDHKLFGNFLYGGLILALVLYFATLVIMMFASAEHI